MINYPMTNIPVIPDYQPLTEEEQNYLNDNPLRPCGKCGASAEICKYTVTFIKYFVICSHHDNLSFTYKSIQEAISSWNKE